MIYLKNNTEIQAIYIPRQTVLGSGYIATTEKYEEGYNDGFEDGKEQQKEKLSNLYVTENGQYEREDGWNVVTVDVPDLNGSYDEGYEEGERVGYNQGKTDGVNEQKGKLSQITISENGTYTKEDGYSEVVVNVPDLNGSYNEGYNQGKTDGISEQKSKLETINITENGTYTKEDGYNEIVVDVPDLNGSYDEGYDQGQADVAANARVLNVTENGVYKSKFSDPIIPELVTGVYADGTNFYNYAELNGKVFNTKIAGSVDSRLEFWYKGDNQKSGDAWNVIIGSGDIDNSDCFQVRYFISFNNRLKIEVGDSTISVNNWDDTVWHHLIVSKAEGLWIDGEKKGDFSPSNTINGGFFINGIGYVNNGIGDGLRNANGTFGMIKIDDVVIIPTADGFQNVNTGELLEVVKDGNYTFTENLPIYGEGELYKTINVNVPDLNGSYDEGYNQGKADVVANARDIEVTKNGQYGDGETLYKAINVNVVPKVNVQKTGLKFAYSSFTEVPEWADFEGITDMSSMFENCYNLQTIPLIDTSNVTDMNNMLHGCHNLQTIPLLDTSKVTNMKTMFSACFRLQTIPQISTSNVTNMEDIFYYCADLQTIPQIDTSNATNMNNMFGYCGKLTSLPALNAQSLDMPSYRGIFGYNDLPNLTDFGGLLNLKSSLESDNNLKRVPNLTYESCINILNGLYDFSGNGETPNSNQGQLKVHQNFLDKVGDEISIGTNKGWTITA